MCQTLESSDHTSVQRRIAALAKPEDPDDSVDQVDPIDLGQAELPEPMNGAAFLSPLMIDEQRDPIGPCTSQSDRRCSDKGFLAMSLEDYLELLDWSARQVAPGKRGKTSENLPPVLKRLGLDRDSWCELVSDFGKLFCSVAGRPEQVDLLRSHRTHRRYHLRRRARELFADLT